jgi:ABC-type dipeptide/oligopeptide/nickel transport system permease subunit
VVVVGCGGCWCWWWWWLLLLVVVVVVVVVAFNIPDFQLQEAMALR